MTKPLNTIPDYMSRAMESMADQERSKRNQAKADLWKRNPITGKKVVSSKYNDRCNWRGL